MKKLTATAVKETHKTWVEYCNEGVPWVIMGQGSDVIGTLFLGQHVPDSTVVDIGAKLNLPVIGRNKGVLFYPHNGALWYLLKDAKCEARA